MMNWRDDQPPSPEDSTRVPPTLESPRQRFEVFYSEWISIIPGADSHRDRVEAIAAGRVTPPYKCFGPASHDQCETFIDTRDHFRAVWEIREAS